MCHVPEGTGAAVRLRHGALTLIIGTEPAAKSAGVHERTSETSMSKFIQRCRTFAIACLIAFGLSLPLTAAASLSVPGEAAADSLKTWKNKIDVDRYRGTGKSYYKGKKKKPLKKAKSKYKSKKKYKKKGSLAKVRKIKPKKRRLKVSKKRISKKRLSGGLSKVRKMARRRCDEPGSSSKACDWAKDILDIAPGK